MPRAVLLLVLLLLAAGVGIGFCVPGPGNRAAAADVPAEIAGVAQGHVYTGITDRPETLNPFTVKGGTAMRYVLGFTHDGLLDTDPVTGALRGALAQSWQMDPSGLAFTATLRPGIVFADGSPVTPDDVLFTWQVASTERDMLGAMGDGLRLVRNAQLLPGDPPRLQIELNQRHFDALRLVGQGWIVVQAKFFRERIAALAREQGIATPEPGQQRFGDLLAMVMESGPGTGPYQLARDDGSAGGLHAPDLRLVRNERSWRRQARPGTWNLAGIRLQLGLSADAAFAELCQRRLDWYATPDADAVLAQHPELQADYRKIVYDYFNLGFLLMEWNTRRPPLDRPRVRKALGMLFDRQAIVGEMMGGNAVPAVAYFKPGTPFYPRDLAPLPFRPTQVRAILREEGIDAATGPPLRLRIVAPTAVAPFRQVMDAFTGAAEQAGIEVSCKEMEWSAIAGLENDGSWDGICYRWGHQTWIDPYELFHSGGGDNRMGFHDAEVDDLLVKIRAELDADERARLCDRLNHLLHELQPVAFLVHPLVCVLFNKHIQDAKPGVLGLYPERFWVPHEWQRK